MKQFLLHIVSLPQWELLLLWIVNGAFATLLTMWWMERLFTRRYRKQWEAALEVGRAQVDRVAREMEDELNRLKNWRGMR